MWQAFHNTFIRHWARESEARPSRSKVSARALPLVVRSQLLLLGPDVWPDVRLARGPQSFTRATEPFQPVTVLLQLRGPGCISPGKPPHSSSCSLALETALKRMGERTRMRARAWMHHGYMGMPVRERAPWSSPMTAFSRRAGKTSWVPWTAAPGQGFSFWQLEGARLLCWLALFLAT